MKIAISGPGGCGKDTAAELISRNWGLVYNHSTSYQAKDFVFRHMFIQLGIKFDSAEECYHQRRYHREIWAACIDDYNRIDAAKLYREHLESGQQILTGIRKLREFLACKSEKLFDLSIWIERPNFTSTDTTQEYGPEQCDFILYNDTPELLEQRIKNLACQLKL